MAITLFEIEKEYNTNPQLLRKDVLYLMKWCEDQPHLPKITEHEGILFLASSQYDIQIAQKTIDKFYTLRTTYSDIFGVIDPLSKEIQNNFNIMCVAGIPQLTPDGCRVIYTHIYDPSASKMNPANHYANVDMVMLLFNYIFGPSKGTILVIDSNGANFNFFTKITMAFSANSHFIHYIQDAIPIKIKGLYIVNTSSWTGKFVKMLKPMMKSETFQAIKSIHKLHELSELVPDQFIPKDLGGKAETLKELHETTIKLLVENRQIFLEQLHKKVDETQRIKDKKSSWNLW